MQPFRDLRPLFPVTRRLAYLNHAGVAPLSTPVARALEGATRECVEWGAARYDRLIAGVEAARKGAARLLGADPAEVAFVKNTSEGIAFVAEGFPWRPGEAAVVPEGEFPANVYPWMHLARRGVRMIRVPRRGGRLALDDYRRALEEPGVRVLAVSSVQFETGFRNDLEALGQMCRERGIFFFVDAIQSLGCLPVEPAALGIHALAADAHKWLMGPEGVGILYVAREAWERLEPVEVGWKSVADPLAFSSIRFELRADARKFEPGSLAVIPIHGLGAAVELILRVGVERIREQVLATVDWAVEGLRRRGYRILSSLEPGERSGILTFVPRSDPAELAQRLLREKVFAAARGEGLRLSPHCYNDRGDVERLLDALDALDG
ncbi:MAG: aminotransferase class V-fold PLP-dependent enzyme [Deferrisomatales bacterium]